MSSQEADVDRLTWWRAAKFGLFVHFGLYSIPAGRWGDRTDYGEWIMDKAQIPLVEYEKFAGQFNPEKFDADEWARTAQEAGMRYLVFTTKHHDGFCLFDSAHTDYTIKATPFKRDVTAELVEACRRCGLRIGCYYSIMDWHHPDYLPRRTWETRTSRGADFERYVRYLHAQVEELLTKYGDIDVMWFDGEWESTWTHEHGRALYDLCRRIQPRIIVNNRVDKGRRGMEGMTTEGRFAGDFGTPEQQVPKRPLADVNWEACVTTSAHWGYNAADRKWKSSQQLIRTLVDVASKGGNLLLNVGPTSRGELPDPGVRRLRAIGTWLDRYGDAIYGAEPADWDPVRWGRITMKPRPATTITWYLLVFSWPKDGRLVLRCPKLAAIRATLLPGAGDDLRITRVGSDFQIFVPEESPEPVCAVIAVESAGGSDPLEA